MAAATRSASSGLGRKLDAAGLAAPADEDLGLDHDGAGAAGEDPLGGGTRLGDGVGDLPAGHGQALGDEQGLGVGFLDLHEARQAPLGGSGRESDGTASRRGPDDFGTNRWSASPYSSSAVSRPRRRRGA